VKKRISINNKHIAEYNEQWQEVDLWIDLKFLANNDGRVRLWPQELKAMLELFPIDDIEDIPTNCEPGDD
jgi:hypothetical protein